MIKKRVGFAILLGGVVLGAGIFYNFYHFSTVSLVVSGPIRAYHTPKDEAAIRRIFKEDFYILTANPDYDIDVMLKKRSPNKYEPKYFGKMDIMMAYDGDEPAGFVAYYMKTAYQGHILFLAIDKNYRRKGFGKQLIEYACNALKRKGAKVAKLATRIENSKAQKLYEGLGFKQEDEKQGFKFYRKDL